MYLGQSKLTVISPTGEETFVRLHVVRIDGIVHRLVSVKDADTFNIAGLTKDIINRERERGHLVKRDRNGNPCRMKRVEKFISLDEVSAGAEGMVASAGSAQRNGELLMVNNGAAGAAKVDGKRKTVEQGLASLHVSNNARRRKRPNYLKGLV